MKMTPELLARIVKLGARCSWYHNEGDKRLDSDLSQLALDAWEIPAIDAVEAEMDRRGLVWTPVIEKDMGWMLKLQD
jgi:hypothetical protein